MVKEVLEKALAEGVALTFDDVMLRTGYAEVMPSDVSLESMFSRNVGLKIPIVSAAMDTVTEKGLAIELARLGGIGVIHRNLTPRVQASHVGKVKHSLNGLIETPICVYDNEKVSTILNRIESKGYSFRSFPVLDRGRRLVGILTGNDFDFCSSPTGFVRDVMTTNPLTAEEGITMKSAYERMKDEKKKVLPLVTSDGKVSGMYIYSDVRRIMEGQAEYFNVDTKGRLRVAAAIGVGDDAFARLELLVKENVDVVVIDTAHGDSKPVIDTLREVKGKYPDLDVVAGNVSIGESVKRLVDAGADGVKVGQGPGSICTTRIIAGVGRPQVSAVYECVKVASECGVPICADGGLTSSGDIGKAIGAGAHSVMLGSMLAGTEETPGDVIFRGNRQWKDYRGMGSLGAMEAHEGSRERYSQGVKGPVIPEGVEGLVPHKGKLAIVIYYCVGGLRDSMGYVGAADIEELREKGNFDKITAAGFTESHPHDIEVTKDSPNYRTGD